MAHPMPSRRAYQRPSILVRVFWLDRPKPQALELVVATPYKWQAPLWVVPREYPLKWKRQAVSVVPAYG